MLERVVSRDLLVILSLYSRLPGAPRMVNVRTDSREKTTEFVLASKSQP